MEATELAGLWVGVKLLRAGMRAGKVGRSENWVLRCEILQGAQNLILLYSHLSCIFIRYITVNFSVKEIIKWKLKAKT